MNEQASITERNVLLEQRLIEHFKWLFPKMMEQEQDDGSAMTPYALVDGYRKALVKARECDETEVSMEDALLHLFSWSARDGSSIVKFGTALMWGERYGQGDFEPLRKLGVPAEPSLT